MEDVQPEVRVKASQAVSGFLHVKFIEEPIKLLETFRKKAKTKLKATTVGKNCNAKIRIRHAGVLGLCSYINANPYDVPDYMPGIFEDLGPHLNDPQPIPVNISCSILVIRLISFFKFKLRQRSARLWVISKERTMQIGTITN